MSYEESEGALRKDLLTPDRQSFSPNNSKFLEEEDAERIDDVKFSKGAYLDNGSPNPTPERVVRSSCL